MHRQGESDMHRQGESDLVRAFEILPDLVYVQIKDADLRGNHAEARFGFHCYEIFDDA